MFHDVVAGAVAAMQESQSSVPESEKDVQNLVKGTTLNPTLSSPRRRSSQAPMKNVDSTHYDSKEEVVKHGEEFHKFMRRVHAEGNTLLKWEDFAKFYPNYPDIDDIRLSAVFRALDVDISPYMNTAALTIHHSTHVSKVQHIFRSLGLRHLTVVNSSNEVVGILTRADLLEFLEMEHPTDEQGNRLVERLSNPWYLQQQQPGPVVSSAMVAQDQSLHDTQHHIEEKHVGIGLSEPPAGVV